MYELQVYCGLASKRGEFSSKIISDLRVCLSLFKSSLPGDTRPPRNDSSDIDPHVPSSDHPRDTTWKSGFSVFNLGSYAHQIAFRDLFIVAPDLHQDVLLGPFASASHTLISSVCAAEALQPFPLRRQSPPHQHYQFSTSHDRGPEQSKDYNVHWCTVRACISNVRPRLGL